ncbi:hypothetical protein NPIL_35021 [Nephila pilipes]|uniref:Uncharacterized protein n=1 Tax=Nephila pilipes TaxID=299642 RepID=A0A8X6ILI7_NEPPI|nr:hypothetical protein NPIL_35021 [Nephila pilipes]
MTRNIFLLQGNQLLVFLEKDCCSHGIWTEIRLIKKPEIQVEAYKIVRCLLIETDEEAFSMMLKEALKIFSEKDESREFGKYFEHMYSKQIEVWAYCYRKLLRINTNMHIESMHGLITCAIASHLVQRPAPKTMSYRTVISDWPIN